VSKPKQIVSLHHCDGVLTKEEPNSTTTDITATSFKQQQLLSLIQTKAHRVEMKAKLVYYLAGLLLLGAVDAAYVLSGCRQAVARLNACFDRNEELCFGFENDCRKRHADGMPRECGQLFETYWDKPDCCQDNVCAIEMAEYKACACAHSDQIPSQCAKCDENGELVLPPVVPELCRVERLAVGRCYIRNTMCAYRCYPPQIKDEFFCWDVNVASSSKRCCQGCLEETEAHFTCLVANVNKSCLVVTEEDGVIRTEPNPPQLDPKVGELWDEDEVEDENEGGDDRQLRGSVPSK
jgi:hypothetical protein